MAGSSGGAIGWGQNYTDNSVYQDKQEQSRQRAVVATFLSQTPEYYRCPENDKILVDFIEVSKRPFTIETLNWAYKECLYFLETKNESPFNKILKSLTNLTDSDHGKGLELEQEYLKKKKDQQKADLEELKVLSELKMKRVKEAYSANYTPSMEVTVPAVSDKIVVTPMSTVRRIKHDE